MSSCCSSSRRHFHCSVFGFVLNVFVSHLNILEFSWTKVWWWSNDVAVAVKEPRKMALPYETPLQLRIVTCCCLVVACSWNLVSELSWTWLGLFLNCCVLEFLVQGFVHLCSLLLCVPCGCLMSSLCCSLDSWFGVWACFIWFMLKSIFFVRARCLSAGLRSWVLLADQRGIEPPPAICQCQYLGRGSRSFHPCQICHYR